MRQWKDDMVKLKDIVGDKVAITISAEELAERQGVRQITEVFQRRTTIPPEQREVRGSVHSLATVSGGQRLCSQYEDKLKELEDVIRGYDARVASQKLQRSANVEEGNKYFALMEDALKSYKNILLAIIIQGASADGQQFVVKPSPVSKITEKLFLSPFSETVTSMTVYSEPDDTPALIKKPGIRQYLIAGEVFSSTNESINFELSAQMTERRSADGSELLTHQGLMFDGLYAAVCLLDVPDKQDLFEEHKTSFGSTDYILPSERAPFVHDMVKLLQCHENHFELFKFAPVCDVYIDEDDEIEPVKADRLGLIGPAVPDIPPPRYHIHF